MFIDIKLYENKNPTKSTKYLIMNLNMHVFDYLPLNQHELHYCSHG